MFCIQPRDYSLSLRMGLSLTHVEPGARTSDSGPRTDQEGMHERLILVGEII